MDKYGVEIRTRAKEIEIALSTIEAWKEYDIMPDEIEKISKYLNSTDPEVVDLGVSILKSFYED